MVCSNPLCFCLLFFELLFYSSLISLLIHVSSLNTMNICNIVIYCRDHIQIFPTLINFFSVTDPFFLIVSFWTEGLCCCPKVGSWEYSWYCCTTLFIISKKLVCPFISLDEFYSPVGRSRSNLFKVAQFPPKCFIFPDSWNQTVWKRRWSQYSSIRCNSDIRSCCYVQLHILQVKCDLR